MQALDKAVLVDILDALCSNSGDVSADVYEWVEEEEEKKKKKRVKESPLAASDLVAVTASASIGALGAAVSTALSSIERPSQREAHKMYFSAQERFGALSELFEAAQDTAERLDALDDATTLEPITELWLSIATSHEECNDASPDRLPPTVRCAVWTKFGADDDLLSIWKI